MKELEQSQQALKNEKAELLREKENLTKEKTELTEKNKALTTEKDNLTKANTELKTEKDNLNTDLSNAKNQVSQAIKDKEDLEQKHAPYKKLERLYEVFLEVKGCLNFSFVEKTHSAMDLIAYVLSDSKYYLESLYNKASQELSDKRSDKGEKLAELFDSLFEYIKDNKFERLKEPSAYDSTCKRLYPEQNTSNKMQRVVLIGYTYDKKQHITLSWIWDRKMGTLMEKWFGFYPVREELEARISGLENSNDQLLQAKEKIAEEKTELEREMARLKSLEATDKSELDLQNRRFKSAIEDLKRQNRKLEEENMALKERVGNLKEQPQKLQQPKPQ
ncbi:hypothetical protein MMM127_03890 [Helicobacter pylori]